ncbi:MAG: dihydrofolate reductase family protein [Ilumatobacteraceae bacterium]
MGKVMVELSISLDGYIAGPNDGPDNPLGDGGEALFAWMGAGPERNRVDPWLCPPDASVPVIDEWMADAGAMISGRRTFDIAGGWKDGHPVDVPNLVVTHDAPTSGEWSPRVEFATDGLVRALERAQAIAGDRTVSVCAANVARQLLELGLLDEINLSVAPVLLGGGARLLDGIPATLQQVRVIPSDGVSHLRYRVVR